MTKKPNLKKPVDPSPTASHQPARPADPTNPTNEKSIRSDLTTPISNEEKAIWGSEDSAHVARIIMAVLTFGFALGNTVSNFAVMKGEPQGLLDLTHEYTKDLNQYLAENTPLRHSLMTTTGLIQDLCILTLCYFWIKKGRNWRPVISLFLFYFTKINFQATFCMKYPDNYMWDDPGFPSITITYYKSSNFFFSGLIGLNFIVAEYLMDFKSQMSTFMGMMSFLNMFFQAFFFICLRSNYIIDIWTSAFVGHFAYYVSKDINYYLERYLPLFEYISIEDTSESSNTDDDLDRDELKNDEYFKKEEKEKIIYERDGVRNK